MCGLNIYSDNIVNGEQFNAEVNLILNNFLPKIKIWSTIRLVNFQFAVNVSSFL